MRIIGPVLVLLMVTACGEGLSNYDDEAGVAGFETGAWWDDDAMSDDNADTNSGPSDDPATDTSDDVDTSTDDTQSNGAPGVLLIHEICDHSESGQVKYVEVHNPGTSGVSLDGYALQLYSNGGTSPNNFAFPAITLPAGGTFVVSNAGNGAGIFTSLYGREADAISGIANGNGDDTYALAKNGVVVDVYGQIGVDGTGEDWEYTDSVVKRVPGAMPSTWLDVNEWDIFGGASAAAPFSAN